MDLNFKIKNQIITRKDETKVVNLSENYLQLCFDFETDDWNNTTKFILFKHDGETTRIALSEEDTVIVPSSLLTKNKIIFTIYGIREEDNVDYRITTNMVKIHLIQSGFTHDVDDPLPDDDPDIVEEIYLAIASKVSISDVVDDVISVDVDKPLSANQGKFLYDLINSLSIEKQAIAEDGYFETYNLLLNNVPMGAKINIPKDFLLKSASINVCIVDDVPVEGYRRGDYYFDFVVNTVDDDDPKHLYLLANVLKDVYEGDNVTIVVNDGIISVKKDVFADKVHVHDDRYYTESEVDSLLSDLERKLNNRVLLSGDKSIFQTGDVCDLRAYFVEDGMPVSGRTVYFFKVVEEEDV